jgi:hypothetical protein
MKKQRLSFTPKYAVLLCAVLLFRLPSPAAVSAQEAADPNTAHKEEWVETGRFGAEEPEEDAPVDEIRAYHTKWLYLGARTGPSLRMYTPSGDTPYTGGDTQGFALDTALQASVQVFPFLSFQGEVIFTWDMSSRWAYIPGGSGEIDRYTVDYTALSLSFPVMAKMNFYPGRWRISPFTGIYIVVPLGNMEISNSLTDDTKSSAYKISPPVGILAGLSGALKLGPGMVFADLRYAFDFGEPKPEDIPTYQRSMISLAFGYEWAFFTKGGRHE